MYESKIPGTSTGVQRADPSPPATPAPGKRTLVETTGADGERAPQAAQTAGAGASDHAAATGAGAWKPPGANEVEIWLVQWTGTWGDVAGQAFSDFAEAVRTDSDKSSNVGALISLAGNGLWVLGGFVDPPVDVLGAALSSIGAFVHGGGRGEDDNQLLRKLRQGLDKFGDELKKGATDRSRWLHLLQDPGFRHAGSAAIAHAFLRQRLHIPNTEQANPLRIGISKQLIGQYLHAKHAYIEHETVGTIVGASTQDHLEGISGNVAHAFADQMGIDPMPTKDGQRTANPFHLPVKNKTSVIAGPA